MQNRKSGRFFGVCLSVLFIIFLTSGCGSSSVNKRAFSNTDLEGSWNLIHFGKSGSNTFGAYGSININAAGNISGGSITNFGVDIQKFTGGALIISGEGSVTGNIEAFLADSNTYEKLIIHSGQMVQDKDVIVYSANFDLGRKGIGVLLKKGGDYSQSDINGTWVFPLDGLFTVSLSNTADITSCLYLPFSGDALQCNGTISAIPAGDISGKIQFPNEKPFQTDFNGCINLRKNIMLMAGGVSTKFEGMSALAVRKIKDYTTDDIKGTWKIFMPANDEALSGTLTINDSGVITDGDWTDSRKISGKITGNSLATDKEQGNLSGIIAISSGKSYRINGGGITPSGNIISLSAKDEAGVPVMLLMTRKP